MSTQFNDLRGGNEAAGGILRGVPFSPIGAMGNHSEAGPGGRGVFYYFTDFHSFDANQDWADNQIGAAATGSATAVVAHDHGGVLRITTGTDENQGRQVELSQGFGIVPTVNRFFGFLARVRVSVAAETQWAVGLVPRQGTTDILTGTGVNTTNIQDYIIAKARNQDGDAGLQVASRRANGTARSTGNVLGVSFAANMTDNTFATVGVRVNCGSSLSAEAPGTGSIEVWFNGTRRLFQLPGVTVTIAGVSATMSIPNVACGLALAAVTKTAATSRDFDIDWVMAFGERE